LIDWCLAQILAVFQLYRSVIITERPSMKYYARWNTK